jgi:hypothetical protein
MEYASARLAMVVLWLVTLAGGVLARTPARDQKLAKITTVAKVFAAGWKGTLLTRWRSLGFTEQLSILIR